jgi:integrase/recombinase XerD
MNSAKTPVKTTVKARLLTVEEFGRLAEVPPEAEWFKNIRNPSTKRAYENAIRDFMAFAGIRRPEEFRTVTRAHVIAWRDALGDRVSADGEGLSGITIRHRLSALSSLFQYLCDRNAVAHNPVKGVKRPRGESDEGKTPALGDHQARKLLAAPDEKSLKGIRDRAILATLLYHALRRDELCKLRVRDFRHERQGKRYLRVSGKGEKTRYVPLHGITQDLIEECLTRAGHGEDAAGALFRPLRDSRGGGRKRAITPDGVYKLEREYSALLGFEIGAHALRATSATNALATVRILQKFRMARPCQHCHDAHLRPPQDPPGGQPDFQNCVLAHAPLVAASQATA